MYEVLITEAIATELERLDTRLRPRRDKLRVAEAGDRIALHLGRVIRRAIESASDSERVDLGVTLARRLVAEICQVVESAAFTPERPIVSGEVLRALLARRPDGSDEPIPAPLIPLLDTVLLTNSPGEPRVGNQILTEIESADRIDAVIAFIRRSGIVPFVDALRRHCNAGRDLRVLTTTYTGSTERRALDALRELGAKVRVSYETNGTRLHAKAWLFHRESGFSTAYVGSSNLTYSAQVSGLE